MITLNPTNNLFPAVQGPQGTDLRTADSVKTGQQALVDRLHYLDGIVRGSNADFSEAAASGGQRLICPLIKLDPGEASPSWSVGLTTDHGPTAIGLGGGYGYFAMPALPRGVKIRRVRVYREAKGGFVPTSPFTVALRHSAVGVGDTQIASVSASTATLSAYQTSGALDLVIPAGSTATNGTHYLRFEGGQGQPNGEFVWHLEVEILPGHFA